MNTGCRLVAQFSAFCYRYIHNVFVLQGQPENPINRVQDIIKHKTCNLYQDISLSIVYHVRRTEVATYSLQHLFTVADECCFLSQH